MTLRVPSTLWIRNGWFVGKANATMQESASATTGAYIVRSMREGKRRK
jgi:hypothetical protein